MMSPLRLKPASAITRQCSKQELDYVVHDPRTVDQKPSRTACLPRQPPQASLTAFTLNAIFEHLSPSTLAHVVLVCERWRAVAERLLYTSIVVSEILPRTSPTHFKSISMSPSIPARTLRCCETLSTYPHLAETVRRFHIRWQTESVESPAFLLFIAQNIVKTLLPTFVHLESLELALGLADYFPSTRNFFNPFTLPALRSLSLHGIGASPELILRSHPDLLHFKLGDYIKPLSLAPDDIPCLSSFRGYPVTAASILPGRPVTGLSLVGYEFVTEEDLARIASTSTPIRTLDLSGMSVTPTLLRDVSRHLPHVAHLKVRLALRHTLHFALSGIRLLAALTTVIGAFHSLQLLDLSPTSTVVGAGASDAVEAEEQQLCAAWVRACPSLRRIVFPSHTEWSLADGIWVAEPGSGCR
ncbi:hypothetical protein BV25DRAFT_1909585 [Artomyces pyxidatus]|uniref:Uncharacterized protein n=1 Tax=Artomyces pyxidatus TaxID=48021 RepID=A0ACB8SLU0_9AGAM|nr:hypothetical protein BV25DRAFT_1909585 [Artomyces pyxidatus]